MSDFKNLVVFQKAYALALEAHQVAVGIRGAEYISLKSQLIRAANSIPSNIVEGRGHESPKEFARYLRIAINSASELEFHLMIASDLHVIRECDYDSLLSKLVQVRKMLHGLKNHLRSSASPR